MRAVEKLQTEFCAKFSEFLARGRATTRFHTETVIRPQNIADHSFGVAWLCWYLEGCAPRADLLMAALAHDMAEQSTGDVPSPVKRTLGVGPAFYSLEQQVFRDFGIADFDALLTHDERLTLKRADIIEGMLYCLRERQMGNTLLRTVYYNYVSYYASMPSDHAADQLVKAIGEVYDQLCE